MIGKILRVEHGGVSTMGNSWYWVTVKTDDGEHERYRTQSNSSVSYDLQNPEYRNARCEITLSKAGRITGIRILTERGHEWRAYPSGGSSWVSHTTRPGTHTQDSIGATDVIGPFSSMKLAQTVAAELNGAYDLGRKS